MGVGKASSLDGAVKHIKNLCANLDAETVVTVEKNAESLAQYAKTTDMGKYIWVINKRIRVELWNDLPLKLQHRNKLQKYLGGGGGWGVGFLRHIYLDLVYPIDVLLGLNPANRQVKVMSGRCGTAETPSNTCNRWYGRSCVSHRYSIGCKFSEQAS